MSSIGFVKDKLNLKAYSLQGIEFRDIKFDGGETYRGGWRDGAVSCLTISPVLLAICSELSCTSSCVFHLRPLRDLCSLKEREFILGMTAVYTKVPGTKA